MQPLSYYVHRTKQLKMKQDNLTFEEIQAAEEASENRRRSRNQGFQKMHERDQAVQLLSNGAVMLWHVNTETYLSTHPPQAFKRANGEVVEFTILPPYIPEDSFGLELNCRHCKKRSKYIFNLAEFRRWLRWA